MTINGSVVKPTEVMTEQESMNAFIDGAKKAKYAAHELAQSLKSPEWENVVSTLEAMVIGGKKLFDMKAMSRFEALMAAEMKSKKFIPH